MAYLDKHGLETFWAKIKTTFGNALGVDTSSTAVDVKLKDKAATPNVLSTGTIPAATTSKAGVMTASDKTKLDGIAAGAEVNVQSDWTQTTTSADDYIKNKPDLTLKEDKSNKVTAWQTTPDDVHYPSEKLVKDYVDTQISGSTTYQGTLASEAALTALTNYKVGWYWFVSTAWTSASLGLKLDVGNMIICKTAAAAYAAANFNVIQADIEAIPDSEINALS